MRAPLKKQWKILGRLTQSIFLTHLSIPHPNHRLVHRVIAIIRAVFQSRMLCSDKLNGIAVDDCLVIWNPFWRAVGSQCNGGINAGAGGHLEGCTYRSLPNTDGIARATTIEGIYKTNSQPLGHKSDAILPGNARF